MVLELCNVKKQYGDHIVLDDITFTAENGVVALLGNNGAGKTTLINIIVGLMNMDSGTIVFDGKNMKENRPDFRRTLGYLPQDCSMYEYYTGLQFMNYMAAIKGVGKKEAKDRIENLLKEMNLWEYKNKKIKQYSGGMKHRLGICQAMINEPDCLILDEPTTGLDYNERNSFKRLLAEYSKKHLVIISTHILSDLDNITKQVVIIKEGKVIVNDKNATFNIAEKYGHYLGKVEREC